MILCNRMEYFILERGKEMANKDDEIEKILNEIKGSKAPENKNPLGGQTQSTAEKQTVPTTVKDEAPLEPALNEFPVREKRAEDYKDEYEENEVDLVKDPQRKKY